MDDLSQRVRRLEPRKICIIKPSSLGDVVHCLPILPALRRQFPSSRISWVVNSAFRSLLEGHPDLDRVIAYERGGSGISTRGVIATSRLCGVLLGEKYDLTIDLQGLLRSGLMTAATRATIRVGMADAREGAGWFYTHQVRRLAPRAPRGRPGSQGRDSRWASRTASRRSCCRWATRKSGWAREVLARVPRPRLILNLGARWLTKRWPPQHFAELARRAAAEFGAGLVTVGSAEDRPLAEALGHHLGSVPFLDLIGRTSLLQLAALARESDIFLSNDTGPLHLAAAAGATVIGIYTCTDPRLTGPYGPRAATVRSCVWCAPSFRKTCDRLECLAELTPDRVWPTVRDRLIQTLEPAAVIPSDHS